MKIFQRIMLFALAVTSVGFAEEPQSAFEAGNYASAAQMLEKQLGATAPSAEEFANLALAFEKSGDPVKAALNYQRALLLDPTLKPARNQLATLAAAHQIPLAPRGWVDDVNAVVHPETLVMVGTVLFWLGAFGLLVAAQAQGRTGGRKGLAAAGLLIGAGSIAVGCLTDARLVAARPAVVDARDGAEVLTAPANNSDVIASVPAGSPVGVLSPRGAWTYVHLASGAKGWVQSDRLTPIVPGEKF